MAAGTLKTKLSFTYDNGKVVLSENYGTTEVEVSGDDFYHSTQTIATTEEALVKGDTGATSRIIIKNLDDTNFVSYRAGTGLGNTLRIDPGEVAMFRMSTTTPYMIADTAAVQVEVWIFDA